MSFLQTLVGDLENIVESDMPSPEQVRGVLGALVKRVEQLAGVEDTKPPMPPAVAEPATAEPVAQSSGTPEAGAPAVTLPPDAAAPDAPGPEAAQPTSARQAQIDALRAQLADLEAQP